MKKIILGSLIFVCVLAFPARSSAIGTYFGGRVLYEIPCTCSPYTYFYFTPLYLNSGVSTAGALALSDTGTTYANYYLTAGGWALGSYTTGVQACYMADDPCYVYTTLGTISPQTGTSL